MNDTRNRLVSSIDDWEGMFFEKTVPCTAEKTFVYTSDEEKQ